MLNKKTLGQVFTPDEIVTKMIKLIEHPTDATVLEPSSGDGRFYLPLKTKFKNVIGVELDKNVAHDDAVIADYFTTNYRADVIIGNPPYVAYNEITTKPETSILTGKPNLAAYFLEKALNDLQEDGELIFIVPANIFTNSSHRALLTEIDTNYSLVYYEKVADSVWANAVVSTVIIKIIKRPDDARKLPYLFVGGKFIFAEKLDLGVRCAIKVGGASGKNTDIKPGPDAYIVAETERTGKAQMITYNKAKWLRPVPQAPKAATYQIFVNCRTRRDKPFYLWTKNVPILYDGAVLCLYLFCGLAEAVAAIDRLNNYDWTAAGVLVDGRYTFTQSLLSAIIKKN